MKKPLLLFIIFVVFIVVGKRVYTKYCESKIEGCKKEKVDYEKDGLPEEGVDW